jgi:hypothetical protein
MDMTNPLLPRSMSAEGRGVHEKILEASDCMCLYEPKNFDFRPKLKSGAIDKGVMLSNVTDGFLGCALDLDAYELVEAMPHCGPPSLAA